MSIAWGPCGPESYLDEAFVGCLVKASVRIVGKKNKTRHMFFGAWSSVKRY